MIDWKESAPDLVTRPLEEVCRRLSVSDAAVLWRACEAGPLVLIHPECRAEIDGHLSAARTELGGLLVGLVYMTEGPSGRPGSMVLVRRAVPGHPMEATGVSLRMGTGVWEAARAAQDAAGDVVVGWYHSHPNLGAFFSGTDRATQARFFSQPYSLGLVVDPVRSEEKWFVGARAMQLDAERIIVTAFARRA
jgi:hypothetical protein